MRRNFPSARPFYYDPEEVKPIPLEKTYQAQIDDLIKDLESHRGWAYAAKDAISEFLCIKNKEIDELKERIKALEKEVSCIR